MLGKQFGCTGVGDEVHEVHRSCLRHRDRGNLAFQLVPTDALDLSAR